jgi:branched-chain amino acid transport system permease protein
VRRYLPVLVLAVSVAAVQLVVSLAGAVFYLTQLTMAAYYSLVVVGLCLLMGYAGQISLGQAGFFAIGGYGVAVLCTRDLGPGLSDAAMTALRNLGMVVPRQDLYGRSFVSVAPWLALLMTLVAAMLVALVVGVPVIRLRGHYLAMATLGFGLIVLRLLLGTRLFGEADGISDVPGFPLFGLEVSGGLGKRVENYYIAWAMVVLAVIMAQNLIHSRVGRALRSIHGNEEAAAAVGVNTVRYKLSTFVLGAALAALGGAFLTHYNGGIGPSEATAMKSVRYVAIVAVGGMDNLWGTLLMGVLLNFLSLRGVFGSFDDAVFAGILLGIMLFLPNGLLGLQVAQALRAGALRLSGAFKLAKAFQRRGRGQP